MSVFTVDTRDIRRIAAGFDRAGADWRGEMEVAGQQSGVVVMRGMQALSPVRTGKLRSSIGPPIVTRMGAVGLRINVPIHAPYAKWVVGGRDAIEARPGKVLRFVIGGVVFYRKRVGPARANDFPTRAFAAARAQVVRLHQDALRRIIAQAVGR